MNTYKVTKGIVGYKEKHTCIACGKKIKGKKTRTAHYVEQLNGYFEDPDAHTGVTCSEECATVYILAHMDDPPYQTPFEKYVFPMMRNVYPNLTTEDLLDFDNMKELLKTAYEKH